MSDPFAINGGSVVALVGKECVGIACDLRLGQQAMTVSTDFPKIFPMGEKVFLGLSGLATDVQTLYVPALGVGGDVGMNCFGLRRICIG
jgi:20S proteasome subunit beta 3